MDFTTMTQGRKAEDGRPGGFYTQDEIRHLVRYAAERHITLMPEIEMPAHTGAAIISYPQIGLYPQKLRDLPPEKRWTANERVLAPRPQTAAFMQDVLTEVMDLFPSKYIHIGGDEANIEHWKKCEEMQGLIRELKVKDVVELHSWFIRQMDTFLTAHGRQLVGWDEILQGGLAPGAVVMSWRGEAGGITAAQAGHDVVMAPTSHTYFDYYQGPPKTEPNAIGGDIRLEKVYQYEPIPVALNADQAKHVPRRTSPTVGRIHQQSQAPVLHDLSARRRDGGSALVPARKPQLGSVPDSLEQPSRTPQSIGGQLPPSMKPTLLVLAAGLGTRYGGLKQIDAIGPYGQTIIDYSIYDGIRAGFGKVVFVIRHYFEEAFREKVSRKFDGFVEAAYAYQELDAGLDGFPLPPEREKPWGTGHAILVSREAIQGPFAVVNADDYYGRRSLQAMVGFLTGSGGPNDYAMVGHTQEHLSEHGPWHAA
jgi:hypothetical protein